MEKAILKVVACISIAAMVIGISILTPEYGAVLAAFGTIAIIIIANSKK